MMNKIELWVNPVHPLLTRRNIVVGALLVCCTALAVEGVLMLTRVLAEWHPYDYNLYLEMGRAARQGVNPRTGERVKIKASKAPKFSPGAGLKQAVGGKKK